MKILDAKFVQDFIKMANDGFLQGWHERNGGNLSYRLKPEEVELIRPRLNESGEWTEIGAEQVLRPLQPHKIYHTEKEKSIAIFRTPALRTVLPHRR